MDTGTRRPRKMRRSVWCCRCSDQPVSSPGWIGRGRTCPGFRRRLQFR
jgi:hypothetical protein